ncbi:MAG: ATP-binding protein, partial [Planctomycetota bacterium]
ALVESLVTLLLRFTRTFCLRHLLALVLAVSLIPSGDAAWNDDEMMAVAGDELSEMPTFTEFQDAIQFVKDREQNAAARMAAARKASELAGEREDEQQFEAACWAALLAMQHGEKSTAAERIQFAKGLAYAVDAPDLEVLYLRTLSAEAEQQGNTVEAVQLLRNAITRTGEVDLAANPDFDPHFEIAHAQLRIGIILRQTGMFDIAVETYRECMENAIACDNFWLEMSVRNNLAFLLLERDRVEEAEILYLDIPLGREPQIDLLVSSGFAEIDIRRGNFTKAREEAERLLHDYCGSIKQYQSGVLKLMVARCSLGEGDLNAAKAACEEAVGLLESNYRQEGAKVTLGEILVKLGDVEDGIDLIKAVAKRSPVETEAIKAYRKLYQVYLAQNKNRKALSALEGFHRLREKHVTDGAATRIELLKADMQYEVESQQLRLKAAKARAARELAEARATNANSRARADQTTRNLLLVALGLFGVTIFTFSFLKKKHLHERALKEVEQELNVELSQLVEEKSAELVRQFERQSELEKSLERRRRDESIGQLTGNVAHDFNNLLQVVTNANEIVQANPSLTNAEQEILRVSEQSVETGASIVKQLLAYARQQRLEPQLVSLSGFFKQTGGLLQAAARGKCSLHISDESRGSALSIDPTQLTTALINLIANAVDAMPEGGEVELRAYCPTSNQAAELGIPADEVGTFAVIEVIDEGHGMTEEEKQKALEPFYSTKVEANGTGLGLSSVYGFVRQSHGELAILNSRTGGVRVAMSFPVAEEDSVTDTSDVSHGAVFGSARVLVVEDNAAVGKVLAIKLEGLGYQVDVCRSADEAKLWLTDQAKHIDILLSDINMVGDMDGLDLAKWAVQSFPSTRTVLMSGYHTREDVPGVVVLPKPFSTLQLSHALSTEHSWDSMNTGLL